MANDKYNHWGIIILNDSDLSISWLSTWKYYSSLSLNSSSNSGILIFVVISLLNFSFIVWCITITNRRIKKVGKFKCKDKNSKDWRYKKELLEERILIRIEEIFVKKTISIYVIEK